MMRRKKIKAAPNVLGGSKKSLPAVSTKVEPSPSGEEISEEATNILTCSLNKDLTSHIEIAPKPENNTDETIITEKSPNLIDIENNKANCDKKITQEKTVCRNLKSSVKKHALKSNEQGGIENNSSLKKHSLKNDKLGSIENYFSPKKNSLKSCKQGSPKSVSKSSNLQKYRKPKLLNEENKVKFFERKQKYRKKITDGTIEKDNLTMFDLIYFNPCTNPMPERQTSPSKNSMQDATDDDLEILEEEKVENEGLEVIEDTSNNNTDNLNDEDKGRKEEEENNVLAPQVRIGPDGELIIDEKSLMIKTTASKNRDKVLSQSEVVEEEKDTSHYSNWSKKRKRSAEWTKKETQRFYKALSTVGTDFSLMHTVFAHRSRVELKIKFKKEERIHRDLIDKALNDCTQFDFSIFDESDYDPEEDRKKAKEAEKEAAKRRREEEKLMRKAEKDSIRKEKEKLKLSNRRRKKVIKETFKHKIRQRRRQKSIKYHEDSSPELTIEPQEIICEVRFTNSKEKAILSETDSTTLNSNNKIVELNEENCSIRMEESEELSKSCTNEKLGNLDTTSLNSTKDNCPALSEESESPSSISPKTLAAEPNSDELLLENISKNPHKISEENQSPDAPNNTEETLPSNEKKATCNVPISRHAGFSVNEISVQTFFPISKVKKEEDGSLFVEIPSSSGIVKVPVPPINENTTGVIVSAVPDPQDNDKPVYHVYFVCPTT